MFLFGLLIKHLTEIYRIESNFKNVCVVVKERHCPYPIEPLNGTMTVVGNQVIYACQNGLKYVGTCNKGEWSLGPPDCKPVRCSDPWLVENALINVTGFDLGSQVFYRCAKNFRPNTPNLNVSVCLSTSKWSAINFKCEGLIS